MFSFWLILYLTPDPEQRWNKEIDIEQNKISRDDLYDITGGRSVPQIIINETVIGGYSELFYLNQSGELDKLLEES